MSIKAGAFVAALSVLAPLASAAIVDPGASRTAAGGDLHAQGLVAPGNFSGVSTIDASLLSNGIAPFPLTPQPFTFVTDGSQTFTKMSFSQPARNDMPRQDIETGGALGVSGIAAEPALVPEPASWAMVIAGFVVIGGALRRRTDTTKVVAA